MSHRLTLSSFTSAALEAFKCPIFLIRVSLAPLPLSVFAHPLTVQWGEVGRGANVSVTLAGTSEISARFPDPAAREATGELRVTRPCMSFLKSGPSGPAFPLRPRSSRTQTYRSRHAKHRAPFGCGCDRPSLALAPPLSHTRTRTPTPLQRGSIGEDPGAFHAGGWPR